MKSSKGTRKSQSRFNHSLDTIELYAETHVWSQRFKGWRKYHVKKPRLPNETDHQVRWVDAPNNKPVTMNSMCGTHNNEIIVALRNIREQFEEAKVLPPCMIICGPSGSGKTTIAQKFSAELIRELALSPAQSVKFVLEVDIGTIHNYNSLWTKITKFSEPVIERFNPSSFRVIVIDNADTIPPSQQQLLKRLMEVFEKKCRWVFVCNDSKKLITFIQAQSIVLKTKQIAEREAVLVLLTLCFKNKIGYDREGIHAVVQLYPDFSLSKMIDLMQKIFLERHFISEENVARRAGSDYPKPVVCETAAAEPFPRCKICTLLPPCRHLSEAMLCEQGRNLRAQLPRNKGSMPCAEFVRFGHCSIFNRYGRCSFDHPKDIHDVREPTRRCGRCTIPWPCHHCDYSPSRDRLLATIEDVQERLHLLKQLVVPDPLINIAAYLDELYPLWKGVMLGYGTTYLDPAKADLLQGVIGWVATSYSLLKEDYRVKDRLLRFSFGELLSTPMLDKDSLKRAYDGEADDQELDDESAYSFDKPMSP